MKISGIGCCLVDNLYSPVDFSSDAYKKWTAENGVADGLITGGLVFGDDLEASSGRPYPEILGEITGGTVKPYRNVGGPGIVAVIHMSQILDPSEHSLSFFGARDNDVNGRYIRDKLHNFNIDISGYLEREGGTPFTDVLSDPAFNNSNGERTFINYIGAAGKVRASDLPERFFEADMLLFGGTGLTPGVHDDLSILLRRGKENGCINCVNTVYDFRNQKKAPDKPWPLVDSDEDFSRIDLLIMDNEESLRISGRTDKQEAAEWFSKKGVHSIIITHGADDIACFSDGAFFSETGFFSMPVSEKAGEAMRSTAEDEADTTGCGDNFAGGVYASAVMQISVHPSEKPSMKKAAALGAVSGGFAGLNRGGVYYENHAGEKMQKLQPFIEAYEKQTGVTI